MKNIISTLIMLFIILSAFNATGQSTVSDAEKKKAVDQLNKSKEDLINAVKGLSDDQLNFKPTADSWSIAECVEHIAISESKLFGLMQSTLQADADPTLRSEVKMTDDQILGMITNRSTKVKTRESFEPKESFGGFKGSMKAFLDGRDNTIAYVKSTADDLRNHYYDFPFGKVDSYQIIIFLSGHSVRHTLQINEVMQNPEFPGELTNR